MIYRVQIITETRCKKFFCWNINVSIPWGGRKDFSGGTKPTFVVTRKLLQIESRVCSQTMQNTWFPICSHYIFIAYLQQKKCYEQKTKITNILPTGM